MIEHILPPQVRSAAMWHDPTSALFSEEAAVVEGAVESRRREFATVRLCARAAMGELGEPPSPLLPGHLGAPTWPSGVVGSMTHSATYRAAAVARRADVVAIGIDAEPNSPLPSGVVEIACTGGESSMLGTLPEQGVCWDRLLFSAKESVYKAWFPATHHFLEFDDVSVVIGPEGTFRADVLIADGAFVCAIPATLEGRWVVRQGLLATSVVVEARAGSE